MTDDGIRVPGTVDQKRELLGRLLRERAAARGSRAVRADPEPRLVRAPEDAGPPPLSFAQERIWFLHQLDESSAAYNIPIGLRLTGSLDADRLERCFREIVARHEVLRTTFGSVDGRPVQDVHADATFTLERLDLTALDPAVVGMEVQRRGTEHAARPFVLAVAPLMRGLLVSVSAQEHVLFVTMHHIVSDAWSMITVVLELVAIYRSRLDGSRPAIPPLSIQYSDYARWQRAYLQGERLFREVAFWKAHLAGTTGVLDLPTDHPRPPLPVSRGARYPFTISPELTASAREAGRRENASLFMLLLSVYAVLLQRYTGQDDLVVGAAVTNRTRPETRPLVGMFINTLPLRLSLAGDPTTSELLARVRGVTAAALAHQELPFEKLVDELKPPRSLNRTPLFQTMMVFPQGPIRSFELPGRSGELVDVFTNAAKFDLCLIAAEYAGSLHMYFDYKADLFDPPTIGRMAAHFQNLLAAAARERDARVSRLPMMTAAERARVLSRRAAALPPPPSPTVVELFEDRARLTPDAPAVVFERRTLTYAALDRRATRLALELRSRRVGPGSLVGIFMDRCPEMVVAVLGVLKARAAYVPIVPGYPTARVSYLLGDSQASVVVTTERWRPLLPERPPATICLDPDAPDTENGAESRLDPAGPDDLAYVIYTSGSTGTPKGAMATHRGLGNYVRWVNRDLIGERVRHIPMVTRLSFDASIKQLYAPLVRGDPVWMIREDVVARPHALIDELCAEARVALNCVPSLWRGVLDAIESGHRLADPEHLTTLILGGEAFGPDLVARSFRALPGIDIVNVYGPTEATANATVARIVPGDRVTIGRPIDNVSVHVLDRHREPVPVGVPGFLHIGGAGVGPGYLHRPDLTAERFVPDPFAPAPGARLYDTGDLARLLDDGRLEFLGRADRQVKVHGHRIELSEVEHALEGHPSVAAAAVVVREHAGDRRLVAYVVPRTAAPPTASDLRGFLRERLPDHFLPAAFVTIDAMPLTANGKVDVRSLPEPATRPFLDSPFVAPQTEMERRIADVWREVLHVDRVGIDDNFFDLGGHSMMAVQVQSKLGAALSRDVSVVDVFQSPTVRVLARHFEAAADRPDEDARQAQHAAAVADGAERLARLLRASRRA